MKSCSGFQLKGSTGATSPCEMEALSSVLLQHGPRLQAGRAQPRDPWDFGATPPAHLIPAELWVGCAESQEPASQGLDRAQIAPAIHSCWIIPWDLWTAGTGWAPTISQTKKNVWGKIKISNSIAASSTAAALRYVKQGQQRALCCRAWAWELLWVRTGIVCTFSLVFLSQMGRKFISEGKKKDHMQSNT